MKKRIQYPKEFKARVALEVLAIIKMGPKIIKVVPLKVSASAELAGLQTGSRLVIN